MIPKHYTRFFDGRGNNNEYSKECSCFINESTFNFENFICRVVGTKEVPTS